MVALYGFAYTRKALDYLASMPKKHRTQVANRIKTLASDPHPSNCKPIIGSEEGGDQVYRIRSGDYRVLYVVRDPTVVVLDIDHRKDIYRP